MINDLIAGAPNVLAFPEGKRWNEGLRAGGQSAAAALDLITTFAQGDMPQELMA